jgi:hypothetical protein
LALDAKGCYLKQKSADEYDKAEKARAKEKEKKKVRLRCLRLAPIAAMA